MNLNLGWFLMIHGHDRSPACCKAAEEVLKFTQRHLEANHWRLEVLQILPGEEIGVIVAFLFIAPTEIGILESPKVMLHADVTSRLYRQVESESPVIGNFRFEVGKRGDWVASVKVTHLETGLMATCSSKRSESLNRVLAFGLLKARLSDTPLALYPGEKLNKIAQKPHSHCPHCGKPI